MYKVNEWLEVADKVYGIWISRRKKNLKTEVDKSDTILWMFFVERWINIYEIRKKARRKDFVISGKGEEGVQKD